MLTHRCPKCGNDCEVLPVNFLGLPIKCICGRKFELLSTGKEPVTPATATAPPNFQHAEVFRSSKPLRLRRIGRVILFIAIALVSITALWQFTLLSLLFFISLGITVICFRYRRRWQVHGDKSIKLILIDKLAECFAMLTVVLSFYSVLSSLVDGTTNKTTLYWLEVLEDLLESFKRFAEHFKFGFRATIIMIMVVVVLDLILCSVVKSTKLLAYFKSYQRWSKRAYAIFILFCSFTFFGNQLSDQAAHLRLKTDKIRQGYIKTRQETSDLLMASVQRRLYVKVAKTFPPETQIILDYPRRLHSELGVLRQSLTEAKAAHIANARAGEILTKYEKQENETRGFGEDAIPYDEHASDVHSQSAKMQPEDLMDNESLLAEVSVQSLEEAAARVESIKPARWRAVSLLKLDGVRELFCQFPKSLIGAVKSKLFTSVTDTYPFLDPLVDVFTGALDKIVEEKVKSSADVLAANLLRSTENPQGFFDDEAERIVDSAQIKISRETIENMKTLAKKLEKEISEIEGANEQLTSELSERRTKDTEASIKRPLVNSGRDPSVTCQCFCGGQLLWTRRVSSSAECHALCPTGTRCR